MNRAERPNVPIAAAVEPIQSRSESNSLAKIFTAAIVLLAIFAPQIFFTVAGLMGFEYAGSEESPIYVLFIVIAFVLVTSTFLASYVKRPVLGKPEITFYTFFILLLVNHLLWVVFDGQGTRLWPQNLILFLSMGITGFMAARVVHIFNAWQEVIKLTEPLFIVLAVGLISAIVLPYLTGLRVRGIGGGSYQAASYYAAVCYGMLGFAAFRLNKTYRFKLFISRAGVAITVVLMCALFIVTVINGGRGAFVLLVLYTALILYWVVTNGGWTWAGILRFMVAIFSASIAAGLVIDMVTTDPILSAGWSRAVEFIGSADDGLIDLVGGSSGRDRVYEIAIKLIGESPWYGYGAFSHWEKATHPHNIFLDLALQFGLPIAISIVMFATILLFLCARRFRVLATEQMWLLFLSLYPIINLMVSSGYFRSSVFWFCISGLFLYPVAKRHPAKQR